MIEIMSTLAIVSAALAAIFLIWENTGKRRAKYHDYTEKRLKK